MNSPMDRLMEKVARDGRGLVKDGEDAGGVRLLFSDGSFVCTIRVPRERYDFDAIKRLWERCRR